MTQALLWLFLALSSKGWFLSSLDIPMLELSTLLMKFLLVKNTDFDEIAKLAKTGSRKHTIEMTDKVSASSWEPCRIFIWGKPMEKLNSIQNLVFTIIQVYFE